MASSEPLWPQALPQQGQSPWPHQGCGISSVPPCAWDQGLPSPRAAEMGIIQQVPLDAWSYPLSPVDQPCPEPKQPWCSPKDLVLSSSPLLLVPHSHQNNLGWICLRALGGQGFLYPNPKCSLLPFLQAVPSPGLLVRSSTWSCCLPPSSPRWELRALSSQWEQRSPPKGCCSTWKFPYKHGNGEGGRTTRMRREQQWLGRGSASADITNTHVQAF